MNQSPTPNPQPPTPCISVVGIGSPFGDDAAGLEAARRLASQALPAGTRVIACDRPGVDLVEMIGGVGAVILIDAVRSGGRAGDIHDLDLSKISPLGASLVSSHGLGVAEAIELARRLDRLPARGRFLGIEVSEPITAVEQALSEPVSAAVEEVARRAARWANQLAAEIIYDA